MMKPTIYEALRTKLGREPTNLEISCDVRRILDTVTQHRLDAKETKRLRRGKR